MSEETESVLWSMTCGACDHEWMQTTPEGSDPAAEEVECPACGSSLLDAAYVGRM
jgi:ribosomal protein S27E